MKKETNGINNKTPTCCKCDPNRIFGEFIKW